MGIYVGENPLSVPGMSAYQEAIKGGFAGTREDFDKALKDLPGHLADEVRHITAEERASWNNKAPGGFGYGETFSRIGHDNITDAEFVEMLEAKLSTMDYDSAAQVTWEDHPLIDGTVRIGTLWKSGTGKYAVLTGDGYASTSITRVKVNGVWQPFEWVNPPMNPGVEYRTTERYLGKPVYCKLVNAGLMPSANNAKLVAHGIADVKDCLRCNATWSGVTSFPSRFRATVTMDRTNITLDSGVQVDYPSANVFVTMYYTKTTD